MRQCDRPLWVKFGLWGLPNRHLAMLCTWLSIASAAFSIVIGHYEWAIAAAIGGVWHWKSIVWVDRFDRW